MQYGATLKHYDDDRHLFISMREMMITFDAGV